MIKDRKRLQTGLLSIPLLGNKRESDEDGEKWAAGDKEGAQRRLKWRAELEMDESERNGEGEKQCGCSRCSSALWSQPGSYKRSPESAAQKQPSTLAVSSLKFHQFFILITLCADSVPICPLKYSWNHLHCSSKTRGKKINAEALPQSVLLTLVWYVEVKSGRDWVHAGMSLRLRTNFW